MNQPLPQRRLRQGHAVALGLCFLGSAIFLLKPLYFHPFSKSASEAENRESSFAEKAAINQIARIAVGARSLAGPSPSVRRMMGPINDAVREGEKGNEPLDLLLMRLALYNALEMDEAAAEIRGRIEDFKAPEPPASDTSAESPGMDVTRLMRRLYLDDRTLNAGEMERVVHKLGFVGKLAKIRNLGLQNRSGVDALADEAEREAARYLVGFAGVVFLILALIGAGLLLLIAGWIQLRTGKMERRFERGSMPPWLNLESFTVFLLVMIAGSFLGSRLPRPSFLPILPAFILQIVLLLIVLYPRVYQIPLPMIRTEIGLTGGTGPWKEALWGPIGYVAALPLVAVGVFLTLLIVRITGQDPSQGMHPIVPMVKGPDSSPLTVVTILLIAVVLAPVLEEITFRGFFYNALRSRYSPILSIAISSAFFAGIHPQGIIGFPMLMAIGIVLATLREWRGSLIAPIIMHACTNGATLLIVLLGF